jgi:hypothetical protein
MAMTVAIDFTTTFLEMTRVSIVVLRRYVFSCEIRHES